MNLNQNLSAFRWRIWLPAGIGIALLALFASWGGVPRQAASAFWLGVAILLILLAAYGLVLWHLFLRPLPAGQTLAAGTILTATTRHRLALILNLSTWAFIVGGFWDEIWHRRYGIPFGEDFFWRPHILMYTGMGAAILAGFFTLLKLNRRARGSFQQRFRANPLAGLLLMISLYYVLVLPADPLWHVLYGEDLTAWSIPHLLIIGGTVLVLLLTAALHLSLAPRPQRWRSILRLNSHEILALLAFVALPLWAYQGLTTDWDFISGIAALRAQRPDWLLLALIVGCASFVGIAVNQSMRVVGAATLVGLLPVGLRLFLLWAFGIDDMMRPNAWIAAAVPLVLVDLAYVVQHWGLRRNPDWRWASLTAGTGLGLLSGPLASLLYPHLELAPIATLIATTVCALGAGWLGARLGDGLATQDRTPPEGTQQRVFNRLTLASTLVTVVLVAIFVSTASLPV